MKRFASIIETVPQPCRIFGTALRPFCLGHHLLLTRLGLPYADNPMADGSVDEFLKAVFICAHSYEATLEGLIQSEWKASYEKWTMRVHRSKSNVTEARAVFAAHLQEGYRIAPVWKHVNTSSIKLSAPWEELLKCLLISAGFAMSDVLNGYLPERWYDYFTVMELKQSESCAEKDWKQIFYTMTDAMEAEEAGLQTEAGHE